MDKSVKAGITAITSVLSALLGVLYIPVLLMVLCNIIDYITGIIASTYREGEGISSYKSIKGIFKKVSMWLLVVVGAILDNLLAYASDTIGMNMPFNFLIACVVCIWIVFSELISILENIATTGINLPPFLLPLVKKLKQQTEEKIKVDNADET